MRMDPEYYGLNKPSSRMETKMIAASSRNLYTACASSYLAAISMGYMIGYSSPALPLMTGPDGPLDTESASWFGSLVTIGGMLGCPLGGWLVERIGRRGTLLAVCLPFLLGWVAVALCSDVTLLCAGRMLTGLGSGVVTVTAPMYIAEVATKERRGTLGSGVQLSITLGILAVYSLGLWLPWRGLAALGACVPVAGLLLTLRAPETPRYLLARGRRAEAMRALDWLRGGDPEDELRDMEESLDPDDKGTSLKDLASPQLFQPLRVAIGLMLFQQLSGINVVMFYTVSIFQSAGFGERGQLATVVVGAVQVVATIVACALMDRVGRRVLLVAAGITMALSCYSMGYYYQQLGDSETSDMSWLALTSLIVYVIGFSLGWGPIPLLVMSEIFPAKARGTASAITSVVNWTVAFFILKEFSALQAALGQHGAFYLFGTCCVFGLFFVLKFVPETKGKSLEDIELYFLGRAVRGI